MDMMEVWHGAAMGQPHPATLSGGLVHFQTDMEGMMQITGTGNITVCGKNLFFTDGETQGFVKKDGTFDNADTGWKKTDYIPIKAGETYTFSPGTTEGGTAKHGFFDASKTFVSYIASGARTFTVPDGACYARFSYRASSTDIRLELGGSVSTYEPYSGTTAAAGTARKSLVGINNVFSDSGNVTVTYWAH